MSPRNQAVPGKARAVCEFQRLEFSSSEGVRLARELWEILRRKKGCTLNRLYRCADNDRLWLAYSEWNSLAELAGARREAARSPLNRRLHSMLQSSSERAYEPFGAVRSAHGINFASAPAALLISFLEEMEDAEAALGFVAQAPGYISHIMLHEVGKARGLLCFAHFDARENAESVCRGVAQQAALRDFGPAAELFVV